MEILGLFVIVGCIYWFYKNWNKVMAQNHGWVRKFTVHYATQSMCLYGDGPGDVPERLMGLMEGRIASDTQQTFIASLASYLQYECKRDLKRGDYQLALADVRKLLSVQAKNANSNSELRRLISAKHREDTGAEMALAELNVQCQEIMDHVRSDKEAAGRVMGQILRFNMEAMFKEMFGVRYHDYIQAKNPADAPAR